MKDVKNNLKNYLLYAGILFLSLGVTSCDDDDDEPIRPVVEPNGSIIADDQTVAGNTITVQNVTVGQDSWLAAVHSGEENSDNFIAGPLFIEGGVHADLSLELNDDANLEPDGNEIVLKLYADDDDGEWDMDDEPITAENGDLITQTITIMMDEGTAGDFNSFDANADGTLDRNEFANTYENDFSGWDADEDGSLNDEEFYNTTFANTDTDDDDVINEDEWNAGYGRMYSNYVEEGDFSNFDADGDGTLGSEEWNQSFGETEWYGTYDSDGDEMVTNTEWDEGLYRDWDANDDDMIDEDEYNNYSAYTANW